MQPRAVATVGLLLFLSFVLGYKGDALERQFARLRRPGAAPAAPQPESAAVQPGGAQPGTGRPGAAPAAQPGLPPAAAGPPGRISPPPGIPMVPPGAGAPPGQVNVPPPPIPLNGPANGNLTATLDSVRAPEVSDELRAQRNVYFDSLQKQLADMRQQQPPPSDIVPPPPGPPQNIAPPGPQQGFNQQTAPPPPIPANAFPILPPTSQTKEANPDESEEVEAPEEEEAPEDTGPDVEDG